MRILNYFLISLICFLLSGCCSLSSLENQKCKCKDFEKYLKSEFVLDESTGRVYINERIKEITFENRTPLHSFSIIGEHKECFIGQTVAQVKRKIPLPIKRFNNDNSYYVYTSIEAFNCLELEKDCDLAEKASTYINIDFQTEEPVQEVTFEVIGGKKYLLTFK